MWDSIDGKEATRTRGFVCKGGFLQEGFFECEQGLNSNGPVKGQLIFDSTRKTSREIGNWIEVTNLAEAVRVYMGIRKEILYEATYATYEAIY